jgi:membrane fusion protein, multidrug efflux system
MADGSTTDEQNKTQQTQNGEQTQDGRQKRPEEKQPQQNQQPEQPKPQKPKKPLKQRARRYVKRHPGRVLGGVVVLIGLGIGVAFLWSYLQSYEDTDDAQVDGDLNMISPRIAGTVVGVYVQNNDTVRAGQLIVDLDPRDYQVALERASASRR